MTLVSLTLPNDGETIDASDVNGPFNAIASVLNGNIDDTNISNVSGTKINAGTTPYSALNTAAQQVISQGWNALSVVPTAVTYNGNHNYDWTMPSDQTATLSPKMRVKIVRTTAAPTQCTSLNGTTQYYSKTSPNKLSFTNNFTVSAHVKLSSYGTTGALVILSRYNGTSGFRFIIESVTGKVFLVGHNAGAGNFSQVGSYQSVPLNKWVHITAQIDMSAAGTSPTTSYVMFDGVDVPAFRNGSGTSPSALIQAGNLEIGSENSGTGLSAIKIAQAAIFNAKVTQATMRGYISQGLVGNETALASAYSFNNSILDLNTTTPNDLSAVGSAVATNADSPFGVQGNGTISSTIEYGIIHKTASGTLNVQTPEGGAFPTTGSITSVSYSIGDAYGFPSQADKWTIGFINTSDVTISGVATATYSNVGHWITAPIGEWIAGYEGTIIWTSSGSAFSFAKATLATTTSSAGDPKFVSGTGAFSLSMSQGGGYVYREGGISVAAQTIYYLNGAQHTGLSNNFVYNGGISPIVIYLKNAYL